MDDFLITNNTFKNLQINPDSDLNPEDILLDKADAQKFESQISKKKFVILFSLIGISMLVLALKAFDLQILNTKNYSRIALLNSRKIKLIPAERGIIYDKNLKPLVSNEAQYDLVIIPAQLPLSIEKREKAISEIKSIIKIAENISESFSNKDLKESKIVKEALDEEEILAFKLKEKELGGFEIISRPKRKYLKGDIFSHVLGYVSKAETNSLFQPRIVGKDGLELSFEDNIRGIEGEEFLEVDAQREVKKVFVQTQPKPGLNLVLNLEAEFQEQSFKIVKDFLKRSGLKRAAVLALDPRNGRILLLLSFPSFDNNIFGQGSNEEIEKLLSDSSKPLFNRVVSGRYHPGSTIKPLLALASLEEKQIDPKKLIYSAGSITVKSLYDPSVSYVFKDWKIHGMVDMEKALAVSSDVYFYTIGGGYGEIKGLGVERIKKFFRTFNLDKKFNIDLPAEAEGFIPDPDWKKNTLNENWYIGDTYNISIGQGSLVVTPLGLASLTSVIANGGILWKPFLVDKIIDNDKNSILINRPDILKSNFLSTENLNIVKNGMRKAVIEGTAVSLSGLPFSVAGKTGTAQVSSFLTNSIFTAFAPYENPEISLVVIVENGGESTAAAVPIAKEILKTYFSLKDKNAINK